MHLEGPYINAGKLGAQPDFVRAPSLQEVLALHAIAPIRLVTMAPEVAGNLALTLGAHGGVFIGGGIVPRLGAWFDTSPFRARCEAKGRFTAFLQAMPVWVITSPQSPALLGAARALDGVA